MNSYENTTTCWPYPRPKRPDIYYPPEMLMRSITRQEARRVYLRHLGPLDRYRDLDEPVSRWGSRRHELHFEEQLRRFESRRTHQHEEHEAFIPLLFVLRW